MSPQRPQKECQRSGKLFTPTGNAAKYCGVCPECQAGAPAKAKAETKRKAVNAGYVAEPPRSTAGRYLPLLDELRADLDGLADRRRHLEEAIAAVEKLEGAA